MMKDLEGKMYKKKLKSLGDKETEERPYNGLQLLTREVERKC